MVLKNDLIIIHLHCVKYVSLSNLNNIFNSFDPRRRWTAIGLEKV
jgi:hypothetical protein